MGDQESGRARLRRVKRARPKWSGAALYLCFVPVMGGWGNNTQGLGMEGGEGGGPKRVVTVKVEGKAPVPCDRVVIAMGPW